MLNYDLIDSMTDSELIACPEVQAEIKRLDAKMAETCRKYNIKKNKKASLRVKKGNANTAKGFNFTYTLYQTLKSDWALYPKGQHYDNEYVSWSGKKATTFAELKIMEA